MRFEERNEFYESKMDSIRETGLVDDPRRAMSFTDEPNFPEYICPPTGEYRGDQKCWGAGLSRSHSLAKLKAMGECVERLALFHPDAELERFRASERDDVLEPRRLVNFSDEQLNGRRKEYLQKASNAEYRWVEGRDHAEDEEVYVPAQTVLLTDEFEDELPLREANTNGAAFGFDFDTAFKRGLLEAVERDAFMITYLTESSPPEIDYSSSESLTEIADYFDRYRFDFSLHDVTTDIGIPTVMAVNIDRTGVGPGLNLGLSSGMDPEQVAAEASLESLMARNSFRLKHETKDIEELEPSEIDDEEERGHYWYPLERVKEVDFLFKSDETRDLHDIGDPPSEDGLDGVVDTLTGRGYHPISVDVSLEETEQEGLSVVKGIVPELHPFYLEENFKSLYSVHAGTIEDRGLEPHPFL